MQPATGGVGLQPSVDRKRSGRGFPERRAFGGWTIPLRTRTWITSWGKTPRASGTDVDARRLGRVVDLDGELTALAARAASRSRIPGPERRPRGRAWAVRRALVLADCTGVVIALVLTQAFTSNFELRDLAIDGLMVVGLPGWALLAHMYGLYDRVEIGIARSTADDLPGLFLLATVATWLGILLVNVTDLAHPRLDITATFWLASIACIASARAIARTVVRRQRRLREPTLIVGTGRVGRRIAEKLDCKPEYGLEVVGFLDDDPLELPRDGPPYLGGTARLEQIVRAYGVERVIVAFSRLSGDEQVELLRRSADLGVRVEIVPRMYEVIGSRTHVHDLDGTPLVSVSPARLSRSARLLKRGLDVTVTSLLLLALSPFFAVAAWRIKAGSPGPVFFRQERMGAGGKRFQILKFRSMYIDADERKREVEHLNRHTEQGPRMFKISDDPRVTPFGRFLRTWSLDELPQLVNVLRGEMSLVGPRPLILDEDENIIGHHRRRLHLTPGLTGLWQVLGRSEIPFSEMITLDYLYVMNWSLWGDIKLLARTVPAILSKRGAY